MKILIDHHHDALRYSLQLLFEKRLGWQVFTQIGLEWYENKYWNVFPALDTARQFLGLDHAVNPPKDVHGNALPQSAILNGQYEFRDGIYYVMDPVRDRPYAAITFDKFKDTKFDIILCSMPQHIAPFIELQRKYQPYAKLIYQVGNAWHPDPRIKNFLGSIERISVPPGINACFYHQEFDLNIFRFEMPNERKIVNSYIHYMPKKANMNKVALKLPEWKFTSFGAGMESSLMKSIDISAAIRDSAYTWHYKEGADGFGHTIHNSYACGRPAIVWKNQYKTKLADRLFEHMNTCIDVDVIGLDNLSSFLEGISSDQHDELCRNAHGRFVDVVDYDAEEKNIRRFLECLM